MGSLSSLGRAARRIFGSKTKVNLSELNTGKNNAPAISGGNASGGSKGRAQTPGVEYKWHGVSPVKKSYRAGRGFLTQRKPY